MKELVFRREGDGPYSVEESADLIAQIHRELESIEDYRLKLKWWMGDVLHHTHRPYGAKMDVVESIIDELRKRHLIQVGRSSLYECMKLYRALSGDYRAYCAAIQRLKTAFQRPVYWRDIQEHLLGGRNNPEVIGREAADQLDYLDAERAIEAIERIIARAREGSEEAAGVLVAIRQSIQGMLLLPEATQKIPRNAEYLRFVAAYPCLVCGRPAEPHHALGRRGTALKPSDFGCIPLCRPHHDAFHRHGRQSFEHEYAVSMAEAALNLFHRFATGCWLTGVLRVVASDENVGGNEAGHEDIEG